MAAQPRACRHAPARRFTYFLSCVFLLSPETQARLPRRPATRPASPNVGFAAVEGGRRRPARNRSGWRMAKATRSPAMPAAISTAATGARPTGDSEFTQLSTDPARMPMRSTASTASRPAGAISPTTTIKGFRAPYLSTGKALYQALARRRLSPMMRAASRAARPARARRRHRCASRCRRSRRTDGAAR